MSDIITAFNIPTLIVALAVSFLSLWRVVHLWVLDECSERMWLIWGIGLAWGGTALHTGWWMVWRWALDNGHMGLGDWMQDNPVVALFKLAIIFGGMIHLRTFTWDWPWPEWARVPWRLVEGMVEWIGRKIRGAS